MYYVNKFAFKINRIRKQNWSAPTIMAVFITICMIIVYSFESLGLAKREMNLEHRSLAPENIIKLVSEEKYKLISSKSDIDVSNQPIHIFNKFKIFYEKEKENQIENILKILVDGTESQLTYLKTKELIVKEEIVEELDFFDI